MLHTSPTEFARLIDGNGVVVFVTVTGSVPLYVVGIALTGSSVTGLVVVALADPDSTKLGTVTGLTSCTVVV